MKAFILATTRKPELSKFSELVFKTLRTGFPNAEITVHLNQADDGHVSSPAENCGCLVEPLQQPVTHYDWIRMLLLREQKPFWLIDTDIIFYGRVEDWKFEGPMAGYRVPEFNDTYFTKAITRARLHTSLLYLDPVKMADAAHKYQLRHPLSQFNPPASLVDPLYMPLNGQTIFYDTMAMMYHAIGGEEFTPQQKDAYFHFHHGTFSDLVLPNVKNGHEFESFRQHILDHPEVGIGLWREQEKWFSEHQFIQNGEPVIAPIEAKDAEEARKWNIELCCGNPAAMQFCDMWYSYCHGIDDLIDTMRDGRPRMSKEQMIGLFFKACLLYNSDFYTRNRDVLAPMILDITNAYQMSVDWEQSWKPHLRLLGDVFRTCGNRMFSMVALICGGEQHMLRMSKLINERDFLLQHDDVGNPV